MSATKQAEIKALTAEQPVFDGDDTVLWAAQRAAERCETPTIARVVGRMSKQLGADQYRMATYVDAAKAVLGEGAPVTAAEAHCDVTDERAASKGEMGVPR